MHAQLNSNHPTVEVKRQVRDKVHLMPTCSVQWEM